MSEFNKLIEGHYQLAKNGEFAELLQEWRRLPLLAIRCSRFQKETSGWSFLHQAAYFGHEQACRTLIGLGAVVALPAKDRKTPIDVAIERGHRQVAELLRQGLESEHSLWQPPRDANLLPSSCLWNEPNRRIAKQTLYVAYGGGVVIIPKGDCYFVDSYERVLVGWHGSYNPPMDMDHESMIAE